MEFFAAQCPGIEATLGQEQVSVTERWPYYRGLLKIINVCQGTLLSDHYILGACLTEVTTSEVLLPL